MRIVHTCRTAALHAILSFLISLFASYDPQIHKILQFTVFKFHLAKNWWGGPPGAPGFVASGFAAPAVILLKGVQKRSH